MPQRPLHVTLATLVACALAAVLAPAAALASADGLSTSWSGNGVAQADVSNAPKIHVVYAYAADKTDKLATYGPVIQRYLAAASDQLPSTSGGRLVPRWDRQSTNLAYLDIEAVRLPNAASYYKTGGSSSANFARVKADLAGVQARPAYSGDTVLVFADGLYSGLAGGTADMVDASQPGPANAANSDAAKLAVVYGDEGAPGSSPTPIRRSR